MSHLLPPAGHPAREMFDIAALAAIGNRKEVPIIGLDRAKSAARRFFANAPVGARRVVYIVLRSSNDMLELVSVGPRGGHKIEWRFGKY